MFWKKKKEKEAIKQVPKEDIVRMVYYGNGLMIKAIKEQREFVQSLQSDVSRLSASLYAASNKLNELESNCTHEWNEASERMLSTGELTKLFYRTCAICGKVQETTDYKITHIPLFD